jgi:hypothetical protein
MVKHGSATSVNSRFRSIILDSKMIKKIKRIALTAFSMVLTVGVLGCGGGGGGAVSSSLPWSSLIKPAGMTSPSLQGSLTQTGGDTGLLLPPLSPDLSNAKLWVISSTGDALTVLTATAVNSSGISAKGRRYDLRSNFGATSTPVDLQGTINTNTSLGSLSFNNSTLYSFADNLNRPALQLNMRGTWRGQAAGSVPHEINLIVDEAGVATGNTTLGHVLSGYFIARSDITTYQVSLRGSRQSQRFSIDGISLITQSNTELQLLWEMTDLDTGATSAASYRLTRQ